MKVFIPAAVAASLLGAASAAQGQTSDPPTGAYGGLAYSNLKDQGVNLGALEGRLGYRFSRHFGVEGDLAFGIQDDSRSSGAGPADVELKYKGAVYGVGFLPIGPNTDLIGRIGYGTTKVETTIATQTAKFKGESWNFGVGAQHHFDGKNGVRIDYTRQEFDDAAGDGGANVWSIGYSRRF
jgi:predicted porin